MAAKPKTHVIVYRGTEYRIEALTRSEARAKLKKRLGLSTLAGPRIVTTEEGAVCPVCGSTNLRVMKTRRYGEKVRRFRECLDCAQRKGA